MGKKNFRVMSQMMWSDGQIAAECIKSGLSRKKAVKLAFKKNVKNGGQPYKSGKNMAIPSFYVEMKLD